MGNEKTGLPETVKKPYLFMADSDTNTAIGICFGGLNNGSGGSKRETMGARGSASGKGGDKNLTPQYAVQEEEKDPQVSKGVAEMVDPNGVPWEISSYGGGKKDS